MCSASNHMHRCACDSEQAVHDSSRLGRSSRGSTAESLLPTEKNETMRGGEPTSSLHAQEIVRDVRDFAEMRADDGYSDGSNASYSNSNSDSDSDGFSSGIAGSGESGPCAPLARSAVAQRARACTVLSAQLSARELNIPPHARA